MSPTHTFLIGICAAALSALVAWLGHRWIRKSTQESNNTANWAAFAEANRHEMSALRDDVRELRGRVDELDKRLRDEQRVSRTAIGFVRTLLRWIEEHLPGSTPPQVPELLREEL